MSGLIDSDPLLPFYCQKHGGLVNAGYTCVSVLADKFHFTSKHGKMVQGYSRTFYQIGINKSDFRRKYLREREATHESRIRKCGKQGNIQKIRQDMLET